METHELHRVAFTHVHQKRTTDVRDQLEMHCARDYLRIRLHVDLPWTHLGADTADALLTSAHDAFIRMSADAVEARWPADGSSMFLLRCRRLC